MSYRRPVSLIGVAVLSCLLLVGCTSTPTSTVQNPTSQDSFPELLQAAADEATSDFEKDVLDRAVENGKIAAADYEEAVSKYLTCVQDAGIDLDATMQPNGIYAWTPNNVTDLDKYGEVTNDCADGTVMRIEGLYKLQVANPDMLPNDEAAVQCLQENDVAPAGYDVKQFDEDLEAGFDGSGIDTDDDLVQMCLNSLGFAVG